MKKVLVICLLGIVMIFAQKTISADSPFIQYFGRIDFTDPQSPCYSWTGIYIEAKFTGTSISATIQGDNYTSYDVFIDNAFALKFTAETGNHTYLLAENLKDTVHHVLIRKRNETNWSENSFLGFVLDNTANIVLPDAQPRFKMEFIGDSFVAGYGNEYGSRDGETGNEYEEHTNTHKAFGPLTARHYTAQYMINAYSGLGFVRNANGVKPGYEYGAYYPYMLQSRVGSSHQDPLWDFSRYTPDIVVIHLGINDFAYSDLAEPADTKVFVEMYEDFVEDLRAKYNNTATFILMSCPVWKGNALEPSVEQVLNNQKAKGFDDLYTLHYSVEALSLDWHPDTTEHQYISSQLIELIESKGLLKESDDISASPNHVGKPQHDLRFSLNKNNSGMYTFTTDLDDSFNLLIYALNGQILYKQEMRSRAVVDISHLAKGNYLMAVNSKAGMFLKSFVLER